MSLHLNPFLDFWMVVLLRRKWEEKEQLLKLSLLLLTLSTPVSYKKQCLLK